MARRALALQTANSLRLIEETVNAYLAELSTKDAADSKIVVFPPSLTGSPYFVAVDYTTDEPYVPPAQLEPLPAD
jgi:hypothetical protein